MTTNGVEIATFHAATGSGRMTVTEVLDGRGYTFHVGGRANTLTIADHEAVALAEAILECNQ